MIDRIGSSRVLGVDFQPSFSRSRNVSGPAAPEDLASGASAALRELLDRVTRVRDLVGRLEDAAVTRRVGPSRGRAVHAETLSAASLGLRTLPTPTRLESTEQVNAIPTSFTPFSPAWDGVSTSAPTVGGSYDGSQGDDVLTFEVRRGGQIGGSGDRRIRVFDSQGNRLETLRFDDLAPNTPVALANGLTLALTAGRVERRETFQLGVSASVGSSVDPSKSFDGVLNDQPGFEPGLSVGPGSFTLNGESIDVASSDSLNDVLGRISASAAGVTASYDPVSELVRLVQQTPGSAAPISFGADSSGFLAATKLSGAAAAPGLDDERSVPLAQVAAFSGVASGDLRVNGLSISLDPALDSLNDVLARIEAAGAGVSATFDGSRGGVRLRARGAGPDLRLAAGSSGLLSALRIDPGIYAGAQREARSAAGSAQVLRRPDVVGRRIEDLGKALEPLFAPGAQGAVVRSGIKSVVEATFREQLGLGPDASLKSGLGISFAFEDETDAPVLSLDRAALRRSEREAPGELANLLLGTESASGGGLLPALRDKLDDLAQGLVTELAVQGYRGVLYRGFA